MKIVFREGAKERLQDYLAMLVIMIIIYFMLPAGEFDPNLKPAGVDVVSSMAKGNAIFQWSAVTGEKAFRLPGIFCGEIFYYRVTPNLSRLFDSVSMIVLIVFGFILWWKKGLNN